MTVTTPPSKREQITEPLGDWSAGFNGAQGSGGRFFRHDEGREYMIDQLVNVHGWPRDWSTGAEAWVDEFLHRYPAVAHDQHTLAVDLVNLLADTVHDPHDWDSVGSVLDLLDYIGRKLL